MVSQLFYDKENMQIRKTSKWERHMTYNRRGECKSSIYRGLDPTRLIHHIV